MPQTRHYEMKDSGVEWIGKMPIGWKVIRNKALFEEVNERCGASPNLTLLSVSEYYGVAPRAEKIAEDEMLTRAESLEGYKICHKNDIVMNIMLAWKRSQGVSQYDGIVSPAYCVFRRKDDAPIDMRYIHYLIRTDRYADEYKCHSTGIIDSRLRLYPDKFLALESHVPPLSEQTAIAAYLDEKCATIDAIVTEAKASIEEYKSWKASVIFETVTKGLNPNAEMKDSGVEWIGEIQKGWNLMPFGKIASIKACLVPPKEYPLLPQISPDNIEKGSARLLQNYKTVQESGVISWNHHFYKGQIIYSKVRPTLNKLFLAQFEGLCSADMYPIETTQDARYLVYAMLSGYFVQQVAAITANRVKMPKINKQELSKITVLLPPLSEQASIVSYLDRKCLLIDGVIAEKEDLIRELENYKRSLIFEVVTGKRRVC